jgi:hypothetical protein
MTTENPIMAIPKMAELFFRRRCHIIAENEYEERLRFLLLKIIF